MTFIALNGMFAIILILQLEGFNILTVVKNSQPIKEHPFFLKNKQKAIIILSFDSKHVIIQNFKSTDLFPVSVDLLWKSSINRNIKHVVFFNRFCLFRRIIYEISYMIHLFHPSPSWIIFKTEKWMPVLRLFLIIFKNFRISSQGMV